MIANFWDHILIVLTRDRQTCTPHLQEEEENNMKLDQKHLHSLQSTETNVGLKSLDHN